MAESPYRHKIDQRQRGRHGSRRRRHGGIRGDRDADRDSSNDSNSIGDSDGIGDEEDLQSTLDEQSVETQTPEATDRIKKLNQISIGRSSSDGSREAGVVLDDELTNKSQRNRGLLFHGKAEKVANVSRSRLIEGRQLTSNDLRPLQHLNDNASNVATSTSARENAWSNGRRLLDFSKWPASSLPQSFDALNPFISGQPYNNASQTYRSSSDYRQGRESRNFNRIGGGSPFTSWPSNGVAFSEDTGNRNINERTYNGDVIHSGDSSSADASSSATTTAAAAAWVLNAAMKEGNAEQIWAKQSQRGPGSGGGGNGGGSGNVNRRSGNRAFTPPPRKPAKSRPMSCSEAAIFLDRNSPPVKEPKKEL